MSIKQLFQISHFFTNLPHETLLSDTLSFIFPTVNCFPKVIYTYVIASHIQAKYRNKTSLRVADVSKQNTTIIQDITCPQRCITHGDFFFFNYIFFVRPPLLFDRRQVKMNLYKKIILLHLSYKERHICKSGR